jgi:phosphomevalonate kinase
MTGVAVAAPGKALLCGEYAVLHGAPAVSVAVDRKVRARVTAGQGTPTSPFVEAAYERVAALLRADGRRAPELSDLHVDSSALYEGELKLGLGSSAAVTTAVVGALLAAAGLSLDDRARIFHLADEVHARAQGARGSGVDVATSVYGGAILFRRRNGDVEVTPLRLPGDVQLTFVFTGRSASTPELVGKVAGLAERDRARHEAAIERLHRAAEAFVTACGLDHGQALLCAVELYREGLRALGYAAGIDIVTPEHQRIAELAAAHGGAAKPSGAGGGDLAVAFTRTEEATAALRQSLLRAGLAPLPLTAPAAGLSLETSQ